MNEKLIVATKINKVGQNYNIIEYDIDKEKEVSQLKMSALENSIIQSPLKLGESLEDRMAFLDNNLAESGVK